MGTASLLARALWLAALAALPAGLVGIETTAGDVADKAVYGADDRRDEIQTEVLLGQPSVDQSAIKAAGARTVAMFNKGSLEYNADRNVFEANWATLATQQQLCSAVAFAAQAAVSFCSGTVVKWNATTGTGLVATAGHCFDLDKTANGCQQKPSCDTFFVFDYTSSISQTGSKIEFPARNVYDCARVAQCDVRSGLTLPIYDYAVAEITGAIAPTIKTCDWEDDGACDVDSADNCPAGTDLADCGGADSPALQAARQRFYPNRTMLDDGAPRPISAVSISTAVLAVNGPSLVMIGHPSGLPRKYAGGATVDAVMLPDADSSTAGLQCTGGVYPARTCSYEGDSVCDVPEHCAAGTDNADCGTVDSPALVAARTPAPTPDTYCDWIGYRTNLDAFAGNSGSGVFTYDVVADAATNVQMVGLLISGATDYVTTASGGNCRIANVCTSADDNDVTASGGRCNVWNAAASATAGSVAAACTGAAATTGGCEDVCTAAAPSSTGFEWVTCAGENVLGLQPIATFVSGWVAPAQLDWGPRFGSTEISAAGTLSLSWAAILPAAILTTCW